VSPLTWAAAIPSAIAVALGHPRPLHVALPQALLSVGVIEAPKLPQQQPRHPIPEFPLVSTLLFDPRVGHLTGLHGLAPMSISTELLPSWSGPSGESPVPISPQIGPLPLVHALDAAAPLSYAAPRWESSRPPPPRAMELFAPLSSPWVTTTIGFWASLVEAHCEQCHFLISIRFNSNTSNKFQNRLKFVSIQIISIKYSNQLHYLKLNLISEIKV
jgi:hypothetical protein